MAKPTYSKPASQLDLEERQKSDYTPPSVLLQGEDPHLSTNGYVGVDPVYQNAANDTEKPMQADKGAEAKVFEKFLADDVEYPELGTEGSDDADEYKEDEDEKKEEPSASSGSSSSSPTPSNPSF